MAPPSARRLAPSGRVVALSTLAAATARGAALSIDERQTERAVAAPERRHPVSRVVKLLKDMKTSLEKEQDEDEAVYEKLACWCETNDKGKTQAIADAESKITELSSTVEKTAAKSQSLAVEIESLEKEIAANQKSLGAATALREKQAAEFTAEEKEMIQSIRALEAAVMVLSKHHEGAAAFLDDRSAKAASGKAQALAAADASAAAAVAEKALKRFGRLLRGTLTPGQRRLVAALAQQPAADYFDAAPTFKQSYAPQSGEIFGILRQMKETFETNLSESQKEELDAQKAYEALKAAKEEEIATGQTALQDKQQQLAAAEDSLVQAKEERADTDKTMKADKSFLMDLKVRCSLTDKEWQERQHTRQSEISAVAEAISILSSDEARDLAGRTFNPATLLQTSARQASSDRRAQAAAALRSAAARSADARLADLAARLQLDAFTQVKKAIDDMVAELLQEAADETKHRDYCIDEFGKNERATSKEVHTKAKLESNIDVLHTRIQGLNSTISTLQSDIADLKAQRERAKDERSLAHKDFENTVADQRQTQSMLQKATDVLRSVYKEAQPAPALTQQHQAPPAGFNEYEKSRKASGVLSLLAHILEEAKALEQEALKAEQQAVQAYHKLVQEIADSVAAKEQSVVDRSSERAQAEEDMTTRKGELKSSADELEALANTLTSLHGNCDYILKNAEARNKARNEEVEALRQAKAFLSGMQ